MHRLTKATRISKKVKERVFERDNGKCVLCGNPGLPEAHFIRRSDLGLGIEENVVTLCRNCHHKFDEEYDPRDREYIAGYLKTKYPDWDEKKLRYNKYSYLEEI